MYLNNETFVDYVNRILNSLREGDFPDTRQVGKNVVIDTLTSRRFSFLSKQAQAPAVEALRAYVARQERSCCSLDFYLNVGGGFRPKAVAVATAENGLTFGEILLLFQVKAFLHRVQPHVQFGITFTLFISDVCAKSIYGIPFELSGQYVKVLRNIVSHYEIDGLRVVRESEYARDYTGEWNESYVVGVAPKDQARIERYLDHPASQAELLQIQSKYVFYTALAKRLARKTLNGFFLAQRPSTPSELCFRSFPGGDGKMHAGAIVLTRNIAGAIVPRLVPDLRRVSYSMLRGDGWPCPVLYSEKFL